MINDYYRRLLYRTVTTATDSAGGVTETTLDYPIYGYLAEMSGAEVQRNKSLGREASCLLFTITDLSEKDRVVDGDKVFEIVYKFTQFHTYYALKRV